MLLLLRFLRSAAVAALSLALLYVFAVAFLLLPEGVVAGKTLGEFGRQGSHFELARYGVVLKYYVTNLAHGQLIVLPPGSAPVQLAAQGLKQAEMAGGKGLATVSAYGAVTLDRATLLGQLGVTGVLLAGGVLLSLTLGIGLGYLSSQLARRPGRSVAFTSLLFMMSLPEMLAIVALLGLTLFISRQFHVRLPILGQPLGLNTWRNYVIPTIALGLLPVPYLARVTANALEDAGSKLYVRAALARGLPPRRILWGHIWRAALVVLWPALPVAAGIVLSAEPVVEMMSGMPGTGRALVQLRSGYAAALALLPLLTLMAIVSALTQAGTAWVNPAQRGGSEGGGISARAAGLGGGSPWVGITDFWQWLVSGFGSLPRRAGEFGRSLLGNPLLLLGTLLVTGLIVVGIFAPRIAPYPPDLMNPPKLVGGHIIPHPMPPNQWHRLGSDKLGRDTLSRLIWGTRWALLVALLALPARLLVAVPLGAIAAWRGGMWDRAVRGLSVAFTGMPAVVVPLALIPALTNLFAGRPLATAVAGILTLAISGIPRLADAIRLHCAEIVSRPFVQAAHASGAGSVRLWLRHLLPHLRPQLAMLATLEIPLLLTSTAFLGFVQVYPGGTLFDTESRVANGPYLPEWGSMLASPYQLFGSSHWWDWSAYMALFIGVLGFTLLGEGLRRLASGPREWTGIHLPEPNQPARRTPRAAATGGVPVSRSAATPGGPLVPAGQPPQKQRTPGFPEVSTAPVLR